jgi:hypothetical protein
MDFGTVLIVIAVVAVLVAAVSYWGTGRIYSGPVEGAAGSRVMSSPPSRPRPE